MRKTFLLTAPCSFLIVVIFLLASCNGNNAAPAKTDSLPATANTALKETGKDAKLLSGNLDTLWMAAPAFASLNPKLTFRFYDTLNSLTLHGWLGNNNGYNNRPPDARLAIGRQSTVQFGSGNYFGNLILSSPDLNTIQGLISQNHSLYVLFAPQISTTSNGQVVYNILLTNDDPGILVKPSVAPLVTTGIITNPSPPRNS